MAKVRRAIEQCSPGDILGSDIYTPQGLILFARGSVLTDEMLLRIRQWKYTELTILEAAEVPEEDPLTPDFQTFSTRYAGHLSVVREAINTLASGGKMDISKFEDVARAIELDLSFTTMHVGLYLDRLREFDDYTYTHSLNVAFYCALIGRWMQLREPELHEVILAGLMHDIGKTQIPLGILNKQERLTDSEMAHMRMHVVLGHQLVKDEPGLSETIKGAVRSHHEREDGSGYPDGLAGEDLTMAAKIVAVADTFDAMTSDRVYKRRTTPFRAFKMFQTDGLRKYDLQVITRFLGNIASQYVGARVVLNCGSIAEVAYIPPHNIARPLLRQNSELIDLTVMSETEIEALI